LALGSDRGHEIGHLGFIERPLEWAGDGRQGKALDAHDPYQLIVSPL
jgi:hypothetical protein